MEFEGSSGVVKKEYVYGGGSMATIAPNGKESFGVLYLTSDHLGTPRVITKADGSVAARHDYKPFGEELFAGTGGRTTGMGYGGSDGNRHKFTGYERDNETGLDFAQARYNSSTQGRFTSPDSLLGSIGNPQSLNRYAYVNNNPMNFTDPTGHMPSGGAAASTHDGEGGGGSRWDDPTSPQAVLNALGVLPSEIGSTQLNDFAAEAPAGGAYNGDGIVDSAAGETATDEATAIDGAVTDRRPLITGMVQPNEGVGTDANGNYRFHVNAAGTSGHDGEHVLGAMEGSTISAVSGLTGRVLTWYTQDPLPHNTFGVFILLSDQKTVMVLKDVENVSSKVRQAPYGTAPFLNKNGKPN